ncbi:helix-turn-helix domain-containing protein [Desulfosarcina ovata]|nr:helix-turn-helix transcriptional regulator [Desulfosarcina ovata]
MSTKKPHAELGGRIREVRTTFGLNQKQMSDKIGISNSTYQYYERGERDVPWSVLKKILTFGVNPEWIMTGIGTPFVKSHTGSVNIIEIEHAGIILKFQNKPLALELNKNALALETLAPDQLKEINEIIKVKLKMLGSEGQDEFAVDRRQIDRRQNNSDYNGEDRRSGGERRKAVGD